MNDYDFLDWDLPQSTMMEIEKQISKRNAFIPLSSIKVEEEEITFERIMEESE